jgi:spore coat protein U-like protein
MLCCLSIKICWAGCTVTTTQSISFGNYNPFLLTANDTTGNINVSCTAVVGVYPYQISLDPGAHGSFAARDMAQGSSLLAYNLYLNLAHTQVWGDGTSGTSTQSGNCIVVLNTCSNDNTVYGDLPAQQNVAVGNYSDTVTVTLNY